MTYIETGEIDEDVYILNRPRIQVVQPKEGSTARFPWGD